MSKLASRINLALQVNEAADKPPQRVKEEHVNNDEEERARRTSIGGSTNSNTNGSTNLLEGKLNF